MIWRLSDEGVEGFLVFRFPGHFLSRITQRLKKFLGGDNSEVELLIREFYQAFRLLRDLIRAELAESKPKVSGRAKIKSETIKSERFTPLGPQFRDLVGAGELFAQLKSAIDMFEINGNEEYIKRKRELRDACEQYVLDGKPREPRNHSDGQIIDLIRMVFYGSRQEIAMDFRKFVARLLGISE